MLYNSDDIHSFGGVPIFWNGKKWNKGLANLYRYIDATLDDEMSKMTKVEGISIEPQKLLWSHTGQASKISKDLLLMPPTRVNFDSRVYFDNYIPERTDHSTYRLLYHPEKGDTPNWDLLSNTLYEPLELDKIKWCFGAVLTNNAKYVDKFLYLYGKGGSGKGTILKIADMLFGDYIGTINLEKLCSNSQFATDAVVNCPILMDTDSRIDKIHTATNLYKLASHEPIEINKKYAQPYDLIFEGLILTASNNKLSIQNVDDGIMRRALVVRPSGMVLEQELYERCMEGIKNEIPAIADDCINLFNKYGNGYYSTYTDQGMLREANYFHDFICENEERLRNGIDHQSGIELFRLYLADIGYDATGAKRNFKINIVKYFKENRFRRVDGVQYRLYHWDFRSELLADINTLVANGKGRKELASMDSIFDKEFGDCYAQLATENGTPKYTWKEVESKNGYLRELDTGLLHYVKIPSSELVIDIDIPNHDGDRDLGACLVAAASFPETYMEVSRGGGLHLHYHYNGDVRMLDRHPSKNIEIKVFTGNASLRRKLTKCNNHPIVTMPEGGLPYKVELEGKNKDSASWRLDNEDQLRRMLQKNMEKGYHAHTKPSVHFMIHLLEDAKKSLDVYDVRDLREKCIEFANGSTNHKDLDKMFKPALFFNLPDYIIDDIEDGELVSFDYEVFPNKVKIGFRSKTSKMYIWNNPSADAIRNLYSKYQLFGFYTMYYDDVVSDEIIRGGHNGDIYNVSKSCVGGDRKFANVHSLDLYEMCAKKMSLKKWELELGITHDVYEFDFDKPLEKAQEARCDEYLENDVNANWAVLEANMADYEARLTLAKLSGLPITSSTNNHTKRIVMGENGTANDLQYTDLRETFPGYEFKDGVSTYKGNLVGEGGWVYAEPGLYKNVQVWDGDHMHPSSAVALNYFGIHTPKYEQLVKRKDSLSARGDKAGAYAYKLAINSAYGLSKAKYDNVFKHLDNVDNIIAKRSGLFMIDLKEYVETFGYKVVHVKTDSIKVPNADDKLGSVINGFAERYGYVFKMEDQFDEFCLLNKAEYYGVSSGHFEFKGTTFKYPYVNKKLFTDEPIVSTDYRMIKEVQDAKIFVGEIYCGRSCSVYCSKTGSEMLRVVNDKSDHVNGTKGYLWKIYTNDLDWDDVNLEYYDKLVDDARHKIELVTPAIMEGGEN